MNILSLEASVDILEYWRQRLLKTVESTGSLLHPEVLYVSEMLDMCIVGAQRDGACPYAHRSYAARLNLARLAADCGGQCHLGVARQAEPRQPLP